MIPASLAEAINYFDREGPTEVSREAVMAYATLRAIEHYYPDLLDATTRCLLTEYAWIKQQEPARAIKQKRVMSWVLSREIGLR